MGGHQLAAGLWWFSLLEADDAYATGFLGPSILWGTGLGLAAVAVLAAATEDLGGEGESGLASGLFNTTQQVGGAIGLAVLSTIAFDRTGELAATGADPASALLEGCSWRCARGRCSQRSGRSWRWWGCAPGAVVPRPRGTRMTGQV